MHNTRLNWANHFYQRDAMLARVIAVALCPSVWVCLSVTSRSSIETVNESSWILARELPSTHPTLCYKKIGYLQK